VQYNLPNLLMWSENSSQTVKLDQVLGYAGHNHLLAKMLAADADFLAHQIELVNLSVDKTIYTEGATPFARNDEIMRAVLSSYRSLIAQNFSTFSL
jgi:hypothetical protein